MHTEAAEAMKEAMTIDIFLIYLQFITDLFRQLSMK